ncbi:Glycosyltransferase involved in cell wall bisynthesis [Psychrobacillus psychrotolerans]|uniref:Glycosyltransferase involved in cell wall bisynthesis n=1 Tax=Psychrobacillus psychrotolerans TaxID=126156 RepID=A0A1I5Z579_9BACI|nr:glycosyltransferase family 1 protein [Psychrobacillus psychrotolerans]SFQ51608.1 Glycosyltransferase involved in cell wall bisynthesis [Psychrobacillus psychrotolerans]
MGERLRILHLPNTLSKKSGIMSFIMNYYRAIDKDKIQFDFLVFDTDEDSYKEEIIKLGGRVYSISRVASKNPFFIQKEINKFFNKHKNEYKVIHYHAISIWHLALNIAKKHGIKHRISHSHATMYSDNKLSAIRNRMLISQMKKNANHYFACSEAAGRFLYGENILNDGKVNIINNAVDCSKFKYDKIKRDKIRKELGVENELLIGHVGRFNEQKNHLFLIAIFKYILQKEPNTKLILVGEGPLREAVEEKIEILKIKNNVTILGKRNDVADILCAVDIFLLPSLFEGLPFVGVEAQASGLPIVLSESITKEIGLNNYTFISLEASIESWANKILSLNYKIDRNTSYRKIMEEGFDIYKESFKLEKMYLEMR